MALKWTITPSNGMVCQPDLLILSTGRAALTSDPTGCWEEGKKDPPPPKKTYISSTRINNKAVSFSCSLLLHSGTSAGAALPADRSSCTMGKLRARRRGRTNKAARSQTGNMTTKWQPPQHPPARSAGEFLRRLRCTQTQIGWGRATFIM